jgi:hypothetical protein
MILQELIRNIVLYKGFIQPLLQTVKDNAVYIYTTTSNKFAVSQLLVIKKKARIGEFEAISSYITVFVPLSVITGTPTLPSHHKLIQVDSNRDQIYETRSLSLDSNTTITMLISENVDMTAQTSSLSVPTRTQFISSTLIINETLTTGFFVRHTILYFSHETHEKREYLGEFSLPHEENRFNRLQERR